MIPTLHQFELENIMQSFKELGVKLNERQRKKN